MKSRLVPLIVLVVAAILPIRAGAQARRHGAVKIFIMAGQSNMEGYGGIGTLDALGLHPTQATLLKKIKNDDGSFVVRDDVFIYYQRGDELITAPLTVGQGAAKDRIGPELAFGMTMGDLFEEPVVLIKTAWGGKDLYCDFRPPSAGKPAYEIPGEPREVGASYRKMIEEVHRCLDHLDANFPQFKGRSYELCGFVWFQGWNDMCADEKIRGKVFDEYARNFALLVQDIRAEFKVPALPVVVGEVGVDGEQHVGRGMAALRAAQAKILLQPELAGTVRYVRTAPFWYSELDTLPRELDAEERRVRKVVSTHVRESLLGKVPSTDGAEVDKHVAEAMDSALAADQQYQKVKAEHDRYISHWECHYWGNAGVYALAGREFGLAMKELLETK